MILLKILCLKFKFQLQNSGEHFVLQTAHIYQTLSFIGTAPLKANMTLGSLWLH